MSISFLMRRSGPASVFPMTFGAALMLFAAGCAEGPPAPSSPEATPASRASLAPAPARGGRMYFRDVTQASGIRFAHQQGRRLKHLPETIAPGAAVLDFDDDGLLDVFLVQGSGPTNGTGPAPIPVAPLYRNTGHMVFEDVTAPAGIDLRCFGMGCLAIDLNNDGYTDFMVAAYRDPCALFLNNGDGTFREAARELGVQGDDRWKSFVTALDYDRDGLLDLFVGRFVRFRAEDWVANPPDLQVKDDASRFVPETLLLNPWPPQEKNLYRNRMPLAFQDVSQHAGVVDATGRGHAAIGMDFDRDGWPDLFVANDASPSGVYHNRGDGTFADIGRSSWAGESRGSMGMALSDYKNDGAMAILITHFINDIPALYVSRFRSSSKGRSISFLDRAQTAGLGEPGNEYVGWGCAFLDVDRDGWEDLLIINGHTFYRREGPRGELEPQQALFFVNDRQGRFKRVMPSPDDPALSRLRVGRGAAFGDLDRDGAADVVVCSNNGPAEIWHTRPLDRSWIGLELVGTASNRDAIGSRVTLHGGPRPQMRDLITGESFYSSNARCLLFGLADHRGSVEATARWPSGREERFPRLTPGGFRRLVEGSGQPSAQP